ncbi:MAG: AMP-binding protein, partial [Nitrosopumilaceae archaeon]
MASESYPIGLGHNDYETRKRAQADFIAFWAEQAKNLHWFEEWERTLEWHAPFAKWFVGGKLNASYNALDVHQQKRGTKPAILWEGENGESRVLTYHDLWVEVNKFSNVLKSLGTTKGDRVTIYLPMVPELIIAMLACARIGATHTVVFSGFSASSLRDRIEDSKSKIVITADGGLRRGTVVKLKEVVDEAISDFDFVQN